jgi:hypothetical protein
MLEQALCSAEGLGTLERSKQKAATKKKTKPRGGGIVIVPDTESPTSPAVPVPPRRPLSAHIQPSSSTGAGASPTLPSSPRRHSYNLDSRDPAADTVFEPLPVSSRVATSTEPGHGEVGEAAQGVSLEEEPFPNLGRNQPVENNLPSSGSTHLLLPPPAERISSPTSSSTSLTPPTSDSASKEDRPTTKKPKAKGPAGFPSAEDLMHRLFLGISGVADQLQTNHAKDLRVILKNVFQVCQSETDEDDEEDFILCPNDSSQSKYGSGMNNLEPCSPEPQSPLITASQSKWDGGKGKGRGKGEGRRRREEEGGGGLGEGGGGEEGRSHIDTLYLWGEDTSHLNQVKQPLQYPQNLSESRSNISVVGMHKPC